MLGNGTLEAKLAITVAGASRAAAAAVEKAGGTITILGADKAAEGGA